MIKNGKKLNEKRTMDDKVNQKEKEIQMKKTKTKK